MLYKQLICLVGGQQQDIKIQVFACKLFYAIQKYVEIKVKIGGLIPICVQLVQEITQSFDYQKYVYLEQLSELIGCLINSGKSLADQSEQQNVQQLIQYIRQNVDLLLAIPLPIVKFVQLIFTSQNKGIVE